jgi:hypothetical protein
MEPTGMMEMLSRVLVVSLLLSFGVQLAEIALPHASEDFRIGLREITAGRFRWRYWGLALGAGIVLPAIIVGLFAFRSASVPRVVIASAAALALAGVWWFEDIWVKAGQVVPLS